MSEQPKKPHLLYLDKSTPEEFQNAELMDWIYLVGDISTQYELDFVRQFGHAMKSRQHPAPTQGTSKLCFGTITLVAEECRKCNEIETCKQKQSILDYQKQEIATAAARKVREDVLDKVIAWKRKHGYWFTVNAISGEKRYHFEPDRFEEFIESLRSTQQQAGEP